MTKPELEGTCWTCHDTHSTTADCHMDPVELQLCLQNTRPMPNHDFRKQLIGTEEIMGFFSLDEVGSAISNYGVTVKDIRSAQLLIKDLGGMGVRGVTYINVNGKELIKILGKSNLSKFLKRSVYSIKDLTVVELGVGKFGMQAAKAIARKQCIFVSAAVRTLQYCFSDEKSLTKLIGGLACDVVKIELTLTAASIAGTIAAGASTFVAAPIIATVIVGVLVTVALDALDREYHFTDKFCDLLDGAAQQAVLFAGTAKDGFVDLVEMLEDGMLDMNRKFTLKEVNTYVYPSIIHHAGE